MTYNEEQELLTLTRDNNRMLKDIWVAISNPNDLKDFMMNVVANQFGRK